MGVNIRRRTGLGVSERLGYDHQRCAISDHQTGVCMAEGMDGHLWEAASGDEL